MILKTIINSIKDKNNNTEKLKWVNKKLNSLKGSNNSRIEEVFKRTKEKVNRTKNRLDNSERYKRGGRALKKPAEMLDNREYKKIAEIEEVFWKELFWILNSDSSHISVDSEVFKVLEEIWSNLEEIKDESVLNGRIENIKFDTNAIKINGITIDCTKELSHLHPTDTQNSIKEIKKSDQTLTNLEGVIPELEKRFDKNIEILGKISKEQKFFNGTSRELSEIDGNLSEITSLKEEILNFVKSE